MRVAAMTAAERKGAGHSAATAAEEHPSRVYPPLHSTPVELTVTGAAAAAAAIVEVAVAVVVMLCWKVQSPVSWMIQEGDLACLVWVDCHQFELLPIIGG